MDLQSESGSSSKRSIHFDENHDQDKPLIGLEGSEVFSFSSSSSSSSDFPEAYIVLSKAPARIPPAQVSSQVTFSNPSSYAGSQNSSSSAYVQQNQMMGVPGYDPNRIPSSVFASRPATPLDWSIASNDSLFSIQIGNTSFSRDHVLALYKSGELHRLDEPMNLIPPSVNTLPKVTESSHTERNSEKAKESAEKEVIVEESDGENESEDEVKSGKVGKGEAKGTNKKESEEKESEENETVEKKPEVLVEIQEIKEEDTSKEIKTAKAANLHHCTSASCRSDTSNNSSRSFAFPLLLDNEGANNLVKGQAKKTRTQQQQPPGQELQKPPPGKPQLQSPKAPRNSWFSCFYRCPLRC